MNCKPGDLAVIVRAHTFPQIVGRIVTCVSVKGFSQGAPIWKVKEALPLGPWIHDDQLRPIRDSDGEDEMLRIAGKPREKVEG